MRVTHTMTYEDFKEVNRVSTAYRQKGLGPYARICIAIVLMWIIMLAGMCFAIYCSTPAGEPLIFKDTFWACGIGFVACLVLYPAIFSWARRRTMLRVFKAQCPIPSTVFEFTDAHLGMANAKGRAERYWSGFVHCAADDRYLVLMETAMLGIALPREAFASNEEFAAAVTFAKEKVHG